jgi:hypothetical protein
MHAPPRVHARTSLIPARAPVIPVPRVTGADAAAPPPRIARPDQTSPELDGAIRGQLGGGRPLPAEVAEFMEPRFKASFANVRIHTDGKAENLATRLGAKAFTFGRDIFFNGGQFQPETSEGMELIAHELTHTIQQREVVQRETDAAAPVEVRESSSPQVQRGIVSRALDWVADKANYIPGFRLFTVVIGLNPINMSRVERSGANILRALIEFIPGGHLIVEALNNHGVFEKGGKFIEDQFRTLGMVGGAFRDALMAFIDSLGWRDIFHLGSLWGRAKRIFTDPIDRLIDFGKGLVKGVAEIVKTAILKPLGKWAAGKIPYWNLLVGVFGSNPISDEKESPAEKLIGAFMELIGQKEIWDNIQKGGAVAKAWNWFKTAMKGALQLVLSLPGRVMATIRSLTIWDIVTIAGAFGKVMGAFASFAKDFFRWAGTTVLNLLEIILIVVAPTVVPYLKKAGAAFSTIIKAPGRFIGYLVQAGKKGFDQFVKNIVKHLTDALFKWLLGSAEGAGIYMPKGFQLVELLKFGLSVLGLTWANIRSKLVAATNETVVKALETGFDLVVTLVREGPAAAWEQLLQNLSNLKQMVVDAVIDMVKSEVVRIAVEKVLSMLTPAGAFIEAVRSIYRTVMFIVDKLKQIGALVAAFIDGLAAIAAGTIAPAATRVEDVLAKGMSLALAFLANFAGLGNVPKKVMELIKKVRDPVDKALDKVVQWVVAQARRLGQSIAQAGVPHDPNERLRLAGQAAVAVTRRLQGSRITVALIAPLLVAIKTRYGLASIQPFQRGAEWFVLMVINPRAEWRLELSETADQDVGLFRRAFGQRLFSRREAEDEVGLSKSTVLSRINEMRTAGGLFALASSSSDVGTLYSFDRDKCGLRETNPNNRSRYGYQNPPKTSPAGLQILSKKFSVAEPTPTPTERTDSDFHQRKAYYDSWNGSRKHFRFPVAILGHKGTGASGHWNREGHKQTRADNTAWNRDPKNYGGPEHEAESSASGGSAERYLVPCKAIGSHRSWW